MTRAAIVVALATALLAMLWMRGATRVPWPRPAEASASSLAPPREASPARDPSPPPVRTLLPSDRASASTATARQKLRGVLVDAAGMRVPGTIVLYETASTRFPSRHAVETDDDGAFAIPLDVEGRYVVLGIADGYWTTALLEIAGSEPLPEVVLVLRELGKIRGVVVDERGVPRSGGRLELWCPDVLAPNDRATPWSREGVRLGSDLVGDDGSFVFAVAPDRTYDLSYHPRDDRPVAAEWHGIRATEVPQTLTARSEDLRCGLVTGTLRDADGAPVVRYRIRIGSVWRPIDDPAEGRFEVHAKWGAEGPILVLCDGLLYPFDDCRIDREVQDLALRLPRLGTLVVRVRDGAGGPLDDATVSADLDLPGESFAPDRWLLLRRAHERGATYCAELPPGRYLVRATVIDPSADAIDDIGSHIDPDVLAKQIRDAETAALVRSGVEQSIELVIPAR